MYKDILNQNTTINDSDAIKQSLSNILSTQKGTMPGKPDFGCNLNSYIFEIMDHILIDAIKSDITSNIFKYEPRIEITSIDFIQMEEYHKIVIKIYYKLKNVAIQDYFDYIIKY